MDLELKKSKDDKNFLRKTRTGFTLSILKNDSHTTPERSPPAEEVEEDTIGFAREAESFSSDFPYFQISMKRSSVDKVYIMVRTLALFPLPFTLSVGIIIGY